MAKRLSSLTTSGLEKALPPMPSSPDSASPTRLRKPAPQQSHARNASGQYLTPAAVEPTLPTLHDLQQQEGPLVAPPRISGTYPRSGSQDRNRPTTPNNYSRPTTPTLQVPNTQSPITPTSPGSRASSAEKETKKKRHGLFGRSKKDSAEDRGPVAWIAGHPQKLAYDSDGLVAARPMRELWDEADGNCYVYLFPRNSGRGASFKINSAVFASSPVLTKLAFGDVYSHSAVAAGGEHGQAPLDARMQNLGINDLHTPPATPKRNLDTTSSISYGDSRSRLSNLSDTSPQQTHLYLPIRLTSDAPSAPTSTPPPKSRGPDRRDPALDDLQTLIDIRNFFAFLLGQALVATERKHSFFQIFMSIAGILRTYDFSNLDGSTYGEVPSTSFDGYVSELRLGDVRKSREKTLESLVLGERMKSVLLYNEAFTHAAGKHEDLVSLKSPTFNLISPVTQNRLIRAAMDLDKRTASVRLILNDFDFPSLFTGIMISKTSEERKQGVRFDEWKDAFLGMRKWYISTLQQRYGHWPPKAKSKKNDLETSGLNRLVLRDVYDDMSSLYDLLVDRTHLTTRTVDGVNRADMAREEPTTRALRAVLSEYDRSSPPVKPPIPFDLPRLPDLKTTRPDFGRGDKKADLKAIGKKIKDEEITQLLRASWNDDVVVTPFINAFRDLERRAAHSCTIAQIVDLRLGQWLFMYVILQALPMLACDAPGLHYTSGVEYFLCEPPRSGVPWANPNASAIGPGAGANGGGARRTWFSVGEGGGVVSLPSDVVEHGVEGIYRRSHCWVMAEKWSAANPFLNSALHEKESMDAAQDAGLDNGLAPPGTIGSGGMLHPHPSNDTASYTSQRHSSLGMGLEALPLPVGVTPNGIPGRPGSAMSNGSSRPRSAHAVDASKTFDAILANVGDGGKKGKRK